MKITGKAIVVLCVLVVLSVSAAFGQAKPASIRLMMDGTFNAPENGEQIMINAYEALTGVDLTLMHPIHNEYLPKVDLAFATGDIPDVLILGNNQYLKYAQSGQLVDLTPFFDKSSFKTRAISPGIFDASRVNGKLYAIPFERGGGTVTYVRGDWLEKLKMKPPTNYSEFIEMLRAFKYRNPDGFKPEEVIPITAAGLMGPDFPYDIYMREFYQDASPDFVNVNGKWMDGMTLPNMKTALERMRAAYAEGLIDKEIIINKTSTCRDKFFTGKVGVFNYWANYWALRLQAGIEQNVPKAKVLPIPAIKETWYIERAGGGFAITTKAKDPAAVFKYFHEVCLDGGKGQTWASFGVEGTMYKMVDGKVRFLPSIENPKVAFTKGFINPDTPVVKWNPPYQTERLAAAASAVFTADSRAVGLVPYSEEALELISDIVQIRNKYVAKIVFGEIGVDEGLAAYAKEASKYSRIMLKELNSK